MTWIVLAGVSLPFASRLGRVESNDIASLLPGSAPSTRAFELDRQFPSGRSLQAVVVYRRPGGLQPSDRLLISSHLAALAGHPGPGIRGASGPVWSPDGQAALLFVKMTPDQSLLPGAVKLIRATVGAGAAPSRGAGASLEVAVTGQGAFEADVLNSFAGVDSVLLIATAVLVALLLMLTYRSPTLWLLPLAVVAVAEALARGLVYGLARAGVTTTGEAVSLLTVVVFGVGTDYALLLGSRYREELHRHSDRADAMAVAVRRTAPVIAASSATVVAGMACLLVADYDLTRAFGVIGMVGVATVALAMTTAYPALLVASSRRVFWPRIPTPGAEPPARLWSAVARLLRAKPRRVWLAALAGLGCLALGLFTLSTDVTILNDLPAGTGSVRGALLAAESFPGGASAPVDVVVTDPAYVGAVRNALLRAAPGSSAGTVEHAAGLARFQLVPAAIPTGSAAFHLVRDLRAAATAVAPGHVLLGGETAEDLDAAQVSSHDDRLVVPLVLALVLAVLLVLLRSLVAPVILMGSVVLTFAAALGVGSAIFHTVLGYTGVDPTVPLLTFVFLVSFGIDYNIFLAGRARQEVLEAGSTEGMVRALSATGGVLTSAGAILAGTFAVLAVLPLLPSRELGVIVAMGVLLDTLVVRTLLVPALGVDLGARFWWPTRPA